VKRLTLVVAVAAVLLGAAGTARAESGQLIYGGRLAYNYSQVRYNDSYSYAYNDGGHGFEAGLIGRFAVVPGQMGVSVGANYVYREPFYFNSSNNANEMAVSVPLLFEVSPSTFRSGDVYEMIFLQIGIQTDYVFKFNEKNSYNFVPWDRENLVNVGLVIGAVGYFNSHCSLDLRYYLTLNSFAKNDKDSYLYSGSLGLSFYL
jgi:hypothetical protein